MKDLQIPTNCFGKRNLLYFLCPISSFRCSFHDSSPGERTTTRRREQSRRRCKTNLSFYIRYARFVFTSGSASGIQQESRLTPITIPGELSGRRRERGGALPGRTFVDTFISTADAAKIGAKIENMSPLTRTGSST